MTKKQKRSLGLFIALVLAGLLLWVTVFFNLPITATSSEFVVNQHNWTTAVVENLTANIAFYAIVLSVLGLSGYYLLKKR